MEKSHLTAVNSYERIFGAGPKGLLISLTLLALVREFESTFGLPAIINSNFMRWLVFALTTVGAVALVLWSIKSLPPDARGRRLVTTGAFHYLRHPLYTAFLSCFNFGLAVLFNNWIYVVLALILHGVWHWNIESEENLMRRQFPDEYENYCRKTGRFVPKIRFLLHK